MPLIGQGPLIEGQSEYEASALSQNRVGEQVKTANGKIFRYGQMGSVAGVVGKLYLPPLDTANHAAMTTAAAAVGATQVTVTLGGTAALANEYANGELIVTDSTGQGISYPILSHPAQATTTGTLVVTLATPITVALTSSSKTQLVHNPWMGMTIQTTSATKIYGGGVPLVAIPAGQYGWFQTHGWCPVLNDSNTTANSTVVASTSVAGAVALASTTYSVASATKIIGQVGIVAPVDTKYNPVFLLID